MNATRVSTTKLRNRNIDYGRCVRVRRSIDAQSWKAHFVSAMLDEQNNIIHVDVCNARTGGIHSVLPTSIVRVNNHSVYA